jgi:hypothetical protein
MYERRQNHKKAVDAMNAKGIGEKLNDQSDLIRDLTSPPRLGR